jgi:2-phosphosulfolactate phosphatase
MHFDQAEFEIRCEWGAKGVARLAPMSDVIIIVDVLSFSTCVEIATHRGAIVYPYRFNDASAKIFAQSVKAELADKRGGSRYSLSPTSLVSIDPGTRLVLPSPNGSSLSLAAGITPTLTACWRNCRAVALAAMNYGRQITVVPAGEQWSDGSLRPCVEDLIGAGAVMSHLSGHRSPEAQVAIAAYQSSQSDLKHLIRQCGSGKELIDRGFAQDVELASKLDVSDCVPTLTDGAYVGLPGGQSQIS